MENLSELLEKATEILRREINSLHVASNNKLSPTSARDLVSYIKLLTDVIEYQKDQGKELSKLTEAELKAKAQELLNETSSRSDRK